MDVDYLYYFVCYHFGKISNRVINSSTDNLKFEPIHIVLRNTCEIRLNENDLLAVDNGRAFQLASFRSILRLIS